VRKKISTNEKRWHSCGANSKSRHDYLIDSLTLNFENMKWKIILLAAAASLLVSCGETYQATDTGTITVSRPVYRSFTSQYPNSTNVVWSYYDPNVVILNDWDLGGWTVADQSDYAVRFNMDGEDYYAWYDSDGTWIGTAYVVRDYTRLPVMVNTSVHNLYPTYTISSVNREYYGSTTAYEITLKSDKSKVVMLVDDNGNVIKQKVKTDY